MHLNLIVSVVFGASASCALTNAPVNSNRYTFAAPYDQSFLEGYSILKNIGNLGPYVNHRSYGVGRDPPDACEVDQVVMIRRHGERYPESVDAKPITAVLKKLYGFNISHWQNDLQFLNSWKWQVTDNIFALETASGPYNGLLTTYKHGAEYRVRYGHLFDSMSDKKVPMWSAEYERVVQTARKFGEGFFGWNYTTSVAMNFIPETNEQGANSLTPKCPADPDYGEKCTSLTANRPEFAVAAQRLNKQNPGLKLNATDVYQLMYLSVFELNFQGYSDWTNVFTLDEWVEFNYKQDLKFFYCYGPGNKYAKSRGSVYANATVTLLNEGPKTHGPLSFTFSHDSDITPILYALNIRVPKHQLPVDRIAFPNPYQLGDIMPMGGHLTLERMQCNATARSEQGTFVRVVLNEAVIPYQNCQDGPGYSCSLTNYTKMVKHDLPNFIKECKVNSTVPQHLSFFWDYNTTTDLNHQEAKYIPYQGLTAV